ncbi:uncharacterized protein LOC121052584 [Rosa chinensis]|uniref:uncharacterized protein LOC121051535 n=1 Tax=Rosa chinensis TaxID=74649 RepID=UPI001AD9496F|nr:uncharacterized protein LOC121051535 [Rosa chinensis]XP_040373851.1 uncharacterized protein LOC121052584 [Rosa chinensis]
MGWIESTHPIALDPLKPPEMRSTYSYQLQRNMVKYNLRSQLRTVNLGIAATANDYYYNMLRDQVVALWHLGSSPENPMIIPPSSSESNMSESSNDNNDSTDDGSSSMGDYLEAILVVSSPEPYEEEEV